MVVPDEKLCDELAARFIFNCPAEELQSWERILFLVEQAHWFYEDFIREDQPQLQTYRLKDFTELMFKNCQSLQPFKVFLPQIYKQFTNYKHRVPTYGAILLNKGMNKALMVKGYRQGASWGFPKGKINKDEKPSACAAREVLEETSIDVASLIREEDYVEVTMGGQTSRLYIVSGIDEDVDAQPQTRKEIGKIEWHLVNGLPLRGDGKAPNGRKYFWVYPFMASLRAWIKKKKKKESKKTSKKKLATSPGVKLLQRGQDSTNAMDALLDYEMTEGAAMPDSTPFHREFSMPEMPAEGVVRLEDLESQQLEDYEEMVKSNAVQASQALMNFTFHTDVIMHVLERSLAEHELAYVAGLEDPKYDLRFLQR